MKASIKKPSEIDFDSKRNLGNFGEELVSNCLVQKGFEIVVRNYRKRFGEIDIIAKMGDVVAFVEVKFRNRKYFNLSEVITSTKRRKIVLAAKHFIFKNNFVDKVYRFDVALIIKKGDDFQIDYLENAFYGE